MNTTDLLTTAHVLDDTVNVVDAALLTVIHSVDDTVSDADVDRLIGLITVASALIDDIACTLRAIADDHPERRTTLLRNAVDRLRDAAVGGDAI